jgi:hypothetical protein
VVGSQNPDAAAWQQVLTTVLTWKLNQTHLLGTLFFSYIIIIYSHTVCNFSTILENVMVSLLSVSESLSTSLKKYSNVDTFSPHWSSLVFVEYHTMQLDNYIGL